MPERACRSCRLISSSNICPNCRSTSFSGDWVGEVIIIYPEKSEIARKMGINTPGRYALLVR